MHRTPIVLLYIVFAATTLFSEQVDVYSRPRQAERSRTYDAIHYRIELRFEEATRSFWGENTITIESLRDDLAQCDLDVGVYVVTAVRGSGGEPLQFERRDDTLSVRLPQPLGYRERVSFTVAYQVENLELDPTQYGMNAGYALGLDFKPATADHPRLISTLSFPTGARHWFPCYDHPNDKATGEIIATVRDDYQVLANGRLAGVTHDPAKKTKTFHWSQEQPHSTYLFVLVAGPYVKIEDSLGALPINYWVYPKDEPDARRSFKRTPEIVAFFNQEFGYDFPWAKCDQVTIPGIGGGAESTTATVLGESTIHDARADQDFPSHWLVAHEAAHQWWGDLVTMRDWSHTWLNESFATYFEYVYSRHSKGEDEGALNLWEKKNTYLNEARTRYQRPIVFDRWEYPNENFDRHTYQKGAAVLSMLRWIMGDEAFRRSLSHFLHKHEFQPVDTHDLRVAIRESSGQVLDWFFDQWIFKAGHPVFEVSYTWDAAAGKVRLRVAQTQETSEWIPVFETPVVIGVTTPAGQRTEKVWIREREETFEFESTQEPLLVRFDVGNRLLKEWTFEKSAGELLYQLGHDDAMGRMWAASELAGHPRAPGVDEALRESARGDSFWAVRREAVRSLGHAQVPGQVHFMKERCQDPKSRVRAAALAALGDLRDPTLVPFLRERYAADDSYVAQAEALRAIGQCGGEADIPFLREASATKSPRNIIRTAAEHAVETIQK